MTAATFRRTLSPARQMFLTMLDEDTIPTADTFNLSVMPGGKLLVAIQLPDGIVRFQVDEKADWRRTLRRAARTR